MNQRNTIDLEQGWDFMQKGITKLKNILEGLPEPQFSSEDYMMLYTYYVNSSYCKHVVFLCGLSIPHEFSLFLITGQYITCVLRSHLMIIPSSFTTSIGSLFKSI